MEGLNKNVTQLLDYLKELVEKSPKVPMSSKVMLDKKEIIEIVDQIKSFLPDELQQARFIVEEKDNIIKDAKREYKEMQKKMQEECRRNVEKHNIVQEAKEEAEKILNSAKKEARTIKNGSREYSHELLSTMNKEIERYRDELIKNLGASFKNAANEIDKNMTNIDGEIKQNIKELRETKK